MPPSLAAGRGGTPLAAVACLYGRVANLKRDSECSLVIRFDEYVPGIKFLIDTNRRSMSLSFNFEELGYAAMSHERTWHTIQNQ